MRKMNWLITSVALGLGMVIGILGFAMVSNTTASTPEFIKFLKGENSQTLLGANTPGNASGTNTPGANAGDSAGEGSAGESGSPNLPFSPAFGDYNLEPEGDIETDSEIPKETSDQIISDYKQDLGVFFDAWKSKDMTTLRTKMAKAYTGALLEKHASRAETFLNQGVGLDVIAINFDRVTVEKADLNTATVRADYRYTSRDYNVVDSAPVGEAHEQTVHVRVNLIKVNSHWLIAGETVIP
ncbi:hypothetical protein [Paradesulfitobacterium ferrireducens]|uniref:hypothetical protein n=1 Tax=Paradesulfitobacterium ferrireducens TaxID=2816476 RepID=UPI001A8F57A6|nr:hypothetical protein [Paradesulfitobacterium ferrireducens]